jgi:hypothetical protein
MSTARGQLVLLSVLLIAAVAISSVVGPWYGVALLAIVGVIGNLLSASRDGDRRGTAAASPW